MRKQFAKTQNVTRFLSGVTAVEQRGAKEASMLLVVGEAGYGKTATVQWWAIQQDSLYLRAKSTWTPHWVLTELVRELGFVPARCTEELFSQCLRALAKNPTPIIIDEVEHTLHDSRVLESIRDLSDLTEVPVILVGMEQIRTKIARYRQISSRIVEVVTFNPASLVDVQTCVKTLSEISINDDLIKAIHEQTQGRMRLVLNALATIERHAKRNSLKRVSLKDMAGQTLTQDWQARRQKKIPAK